MELTPSQKGAVAETGFVHHATQLGVTVARPVAEGGRYDLILDLGPRLLRVQCKWGTLRGGVVMREPEDLPSRSRGFGSHDVHRARGGRDRHLLRRT
jgi:hypothetical protein